MHTETYTHLKGEIIYRETHTGIEKENTHTTQTLKEHTLTHARTHTRTHTHTLLTRFWLELARNTAFSVFFLR